MENNHQLKINDLKVKVITSKTNNPLKFWITVLYIVIIVLVIIIGIINILCFALGYADFNQLIRGWEVNGQITTSWWLLLLSYLTLTAAIFGTTGLFIANIYSLDYNYKYFKYMTIFVLATLFNSILIGAYWLLFTTLIQWAIFYYRYFVWKQPPNYQSKLITNNGSRLSLMNKKWWTAIIAFGLIYFTVGILILVPFFGQTKDLHILDGDSYIIYTVPSGFLYDSAPWRDVIMSTTIIIGSLVATMKEWKSVFFFVTSAIIGCWMFYDVGSITLATQQLMLAIGGSFLGYFWYQKEKLHILNFEFFPPEL